MPGFCRNNGGLMENHGLGTHSDKMYAKSSTGKYTPNTSQFIRPICLKQQIIKRWSEAESFTYKSKVYYTYY